MPRPVRMSPVPRGFGDGRASQPYVFAAAFITAMERARLKPLSSAVLAVSSFRRNATGSAFAAAASSSMNDSEANVDCGPFGSRRLPVRSGVSHAQRQRDDVAGHAAVGNRVHVVRHGRAAARRRGLAHARELRDQHGVVLVVAEVIVIGGAQPRSRRATRLPCASRPPRILHA